MWHIAQNFRFVTFCQKTSDCKRNVAFPSAEIATEMKQCSVSGTDYD